MKTFRKRMLVILAVVVLVCSALTLSTGATWYEIEGLYTTKNFSSPHTFPFAEVYYTGENDTHALTSCCDYGITYVYAGFSAVINCDNMGVYGYSIYDDSYGYDSFAIVYCDDYFESDYSIISFTSSHYYVTRLGTPSNDIYIGTSSK